ALVFIHGLADSIPSFAMPMALLQREFRCICYNQPTGRNDSARLRPYRPDHLVDDLLALLDHLGLSQAYLLGHSFGSTVAMRALHRAPERFPSGILLCGFAERRLAWREFLMAWTLRVAPGTVAWLPFRERVFEECHRSCFADLEAERWKD